MKLFGSHRGATALPLLLALGAGCRSAPPPRPLPAVAVQVAGKKEMRRDAVVVHSIPLVFGFVLCGLVGAQVGRNRGRLAAGFFFGLLAGPVGWVIVAAGPNLERRCPDCRGRLPEGAVKCRRCGADLPTRPESP